MVASNAYNSYRNSQVYDGMDPKELILLLYKEALKRIRLAREGIIENSPRKRGEHLGRAIAIVAELNSSLAGSVDTEEINFLRGLYRSILIELPKVSLSNDVKILDMAYDYISKLKEIWEKDVMGKEASGKQTQGTFGMPSAKGNDSGVSSRVLQGSIQV